MKVSIKGFIYHKTSERFSDCFDRYNLSTKNNRFAVSDGVSKSFFSGIWAELLVNSFVSIGGMVNLTDTKLLVSIQNQWLEKIEDIVRRPNQKFFVQNLHAQRRSAAATFVGLHFFNADGRYKWEAIALGDSFMFFVPEHVKDISRNFKEVQFLSSKKDFEFDNYPDFFDSRSPANKGKIRQMADNLRAGTFYIMTDALSQWFIAEKQTAIDEIASWSNQSVFENRVRLLREDSLQNDDVAILIIQIGGNDESLIHYEDIQVTDFNKLVEAERGQIEKEEAEWGKIENELREKFEIEKLQAIENLREKHRYERENYINQFTEYFKRRQEDAKEKLRRQHAREWEQFEREWKREFENERINMEQELVKKQDSERLYLDQDIKSKFEETKEERRKILTDKQTNQLEKKEKEVNPKNESIKFKPSDEFDDKTSGQKEEVKKKKGFWESTKELAIDAVSNFIGKKDSEPDSYAEKADKSSRPRTVKVTGGDEENIKKKKKDDKNDDDNKDISSITDKF